MDSLNIALAFNLVFLHESRLLLRGWIEPTENDPATWRLHLLPGYDYPPGHDPAGSCD